MKALVINCSPVRNGATAELVGLVVQQLGSRFSTKAICIDDYSFSFCTGCRSCHSTGICIMQDDVAVIMDELAAADTIVCVAPSYWADIPGQFKSFIDRCTPWSNTHDPHASLPAGKKGYAIALRTGGGLHECDRIIKTIEHFYGHLDIEFCGGLGLTSVECRDDAVQRADDVIAFCEGIS